MKKKMKFKNAFTLAEILIVIAIIGIIVSMLLPAAKNIIPDKEVMKFKKANNAFTSAIRELANSDKYFTPGDFGLNKDGGLVSDSKQFCHALADVLSTKSVNCSDRNDGYNGSTVMNVENDDGTSLNLPNSVSVGSNAYELPDCYCKQNTGAGAEIITSDGVTIYTVNPNWHFGSKIPDSKGKRLFNLCSKHKRYKYYCIDIDGIGEGEDPFGYAVRADGKVILGSRAQAWLERDIQQSEDGAAAYSVGDGMCSVPDLASVKSEPDSTDGCIPFPCGDESIMALITLGGEDYCMSKFNMDSYEAEWAGVGSSIADNLDIRDDIGIFRGASCSSQESKCCWGGAGAHSTLNCTGADCFKTVCTFNAAKTICDYYDYLNKDWKLPTKEQMDEIISQSIEGLNFCKSDSGPSHCYGNSGVCTNTYLASSACMPSKTWAMDSSDNTKAWVADYGPSVHTTAEAWSKGLPASVRCIAKVDSYRETKAPNPCDGVTCPENSICIKTGDESAICMMQYNIGRDASLALGISVGLEWFSSNYNNAVAHIPHLDMAGSGAFCERSDAQCCITYATGYTNSSVSSQYTLTNRTVCNYYGGYDLCNSFGWRLPTEEELNAIAEQIKDDSSDLGPTKNLLQLCSEDPSDSFPHCGTVASAMNTNGGLVDSLPGQIWGDWGKILKIATREVTNNDIIIKPRSVRCVSDATNYKN